MRHLLIISCIALLFCAFTTSAAEYDIVYKTTDQGDLRLTILTPEESDDRAKSHPAIIFYHGGAWTKGDRSAFENQSRYFKERGMVTICVEYRLATKDRSITPIECLKDAKSAMRYVRANASTYNIDPDKIVVGGGSAGGQLAAAVVMCPNINDESDDLSISTDAAAMVLFNPVVANGPNRSGAYQGRGYIRVKDHYKDFSPIHNVREGVPPTIFMVGDSDNLIPVAVAKEFARLIEEVGGVCELKIYEGKEHGFFNLRKKSVDGFYHTLRDADNFLVELGLIEGEECVAEWINDNTSYKVAGF